MRKTFQREAISLDIVGFKKNIKIFAKAQVVAANYFQSVLDPGFGRITVHLLVGWEWDEI